MSDAPKFAVRLQRTVPSRRRRRASQRLAVKLGTKPERIRSLIARPPGLITKPIEHADARQILRDFVNEGIEVELIRITPDLGPDVFKTSTNLRLTSIIHRGSESPDQEWPDASTWDESQPQDVDKVYAVRLIVRVPPQRIEALVRRLSERLEVNERRLRKLLSRPPGLLSKPVRRATSERITSILSAEGVVVESIRLLDEAEGGPGSPDFDLRLTLDSALMRAHFGDLPTSGEPSVRDTAAEPPITEPKGKVAEPPKASQEAVDDQEVVGLVLDGEPVSPIPAAPRPGVPGDTTLGTPVAALPDQQQVQLRSQGQEAPQPEQDLKLPPIVALSMPAETTPVVVESEIPLPTPSPPATPSDPATAQTEPEAETIPEQASAQSAKLASGPPALEVPSATGKALLTAVEKASEVPTTEEPETQQETADVSATKAEPALEPRSKPEVAVEAETQAAADASRNSVKEAAASLPTPFPTETAAGRTPDKPRPGGEGSDPVVAPAAGEKGAEKPAEVLPKTEPPVVEMAITAPPAEASVEPPIPPAPKKTALPSPQEASGPVDRIRETSKDPVTAEEIQDKTEAPAKKLVEGGEATPSSAAEAKTAPDTPTVGKETAARAKAPEAKKTAPRAKKPTSGTASTRSKKQEQTRSHSSKTSSRSTKTSRRSPKTKSPPTAAAKREEERLSAAGTATGEGSPELQQAPSKRSAVESEAASSTQAKPAETTQKRRSTEEAKAAKKVRRRAPTKPKPAPPAAVTVRPKEADAEPVGAKAELPEPQVAAEPQRRADPAATATPVPPPAAQDQDTKPPGRATTTRQVDRSTPPRRKRTKPKPPAERAAARSGEAKDHPPETPVPEWHKPPDDLPVTPPTGIDPPPPAQGRAASTAGPAIATAAIARVAGGRREPPTVEVAIPPAARPWPEVEPVVRGLLTMLALDVGVLAVVARSGNLLTSPVGITLVLLFSLLLIGQATLTRAQRPISNIFAVLAVMPLIFMFPALVETLSPWSELSAPYQLIVISLLLLISTLSIADTLGLDLRQLGLGLGGRTEPLGGAARSPLQALWQPLVGLLIQVAVATSGLLLGGLALRFLPPQTRLTPLLDGAGWLALLGLLLAALSQEVFFRGLLQRVAGTALGVPTGIVATAVLFVLMFSGSPFSGALLFTLLLALVSGVVAHLTGSVLGLSLAQMLALAVYLGLMGDPLLCFQVGFDGTCLAAEWGSFLAGIR